MADTKTKGISKSKTEDERAEQEFERKLARSLSWVIPFVTLALALTVGLVFGMGLAILVLGTGALVGTIVLLWGSVRTLTGDAPLADGWVMYAASSEYDTLAEKKREVLRTLKDLDHERSIGRLTDDDFARVANYYREEAKGVLRQMDALGSDERERAEIIAAAFLKKRGLGVEGTGVATGSDPATSLPAGASPPPSSSNTGIPRACSTCDTANDLDSVFCKNADPNWRRLMSNSALRSLIPATLAFTCALSPVALAQTTPSGSIPPGHPPVTQTADPESDDPSGMHANETHTKLPKIPEDSVSERLDAPAGSLRISVLNPGDGPIAGISVTLEVLQSSVAKGDKRSQRMLTTDASGRVQVEGLERGSGISYSARVSQGGATFATTPFSLSGDHGMEAVLHVYPTSKTLRDLLVFSQALVFIEIRDDRLQVEERVDLFNMSPVAWLPSDVLVDLPEDFLAFVGVEQGMSPSTPAFEAVEHRGAKLRGTVGPGQHTVNFRWQVPYKSEATIDLKMGLPPHAVSAQVMITAGESMKLAVDGFPAATSSRDMQGNRILTTQREIQQGEAPLASLSLHVTDIPAPGNTRFYATLAVLGGVLASIYAALRLKRDAAPFDPEERQELLRELEDLERSHREGELGPKTYEAARRQIVDALARRLALEKLWKQPG